MVLNKLLALGMIDLTHNSDLLIVQVYVDDIIFVETEEKMLLEQNVFDITL